MRRFPCLCLTVLCILAGCLVAALLYRHAWQIPLIRDLRGARLFSALAILLTPFFAFIAAAARPALWRVAVKSTALFLAVAAPAYAAIGSFDGVRTSSRDKAVLCNLRQLAAAADQYFLENNVPVVARLDQLVGPMNYIKQLNAVAGEDYGVNFPLRTGDFLKTTLSSGRTLVYYLGPIPAGYKHTYERGEPLPWQSAPSKPAAAPYRVTDSAAQAATSAFASAANTEPAPPLSREALSAALAKPPHKAPRGTMCASCHAKKA